MAEEPGVERVNVYDEEDSEVQRKASKTSDLSVEESGDSEKE